MILSISGLPFIYIYIFFFNKTELIHSVVLTSAAQRSDAVMHINSSESSFSIILYHRVSNGVPWSIQ